MKVLPFHKYMRGQRRGHYIQKHLQNVKNNFDKYSLYERNGDHQWLGWVSQTFTKTLVSKRFAKFTMRNNESLLCYIKKKWKNYLGFETPNIYYIQYFCGLDNFLPSTHSHRLPSISHKGKFVVDHLCLLDDSKIYSVTFPLKCRVWDLLQCHEG